MTHLTDTTGTVKGAQEVKDFINMCNSKFNSVDKVICKDADICRPADYLQYTLLTNNRIRIYLSNS